MNDTDTLSCGIWFTAVQSAVTTYNSVQNVMTKKKQNDSIDPNDMIFTLRDSVERRGYDKSSHDNGYSDRLQSDLSHGNDKPTDSYYG